MSDVQVKFSRKRGEGLQFCRIYVNGDLLPFTNDRAVRMLPKGEEFELYWRMAGEPGSTLSISYEVDGNEETAVEESKIPGNKTRKSDFTYIMLEGGEDDA